MEIGAPLVARKAEPGQFIILRVDESGERIPLTIADFDRNRGTVTIIFQIVGTTTKQLDQKQEGDKLADFAGPLGTASHLEGLKRVAIIGGGVGCAIAYPRPKNCFISVPMWMSLPASEIKISLFRKISLKRQAHVISVPRMMVPMVIRDL